MLPPVSLPIAKPTNPAAVAAPGPALEPDDPSSNNHGVHGLAAEPDVVERQRTQTQFGDQYRARLLETFHDSCVRCGDTAPEWLGAIRGGYASGIEKV